MLYQDLKKADLARKQTNTPKLKLVKTLHKQTATIFYFTKFKYLSRAIFTVGRNRNKSHLSNKQTSHSSFN